MAAMSINDRVDLYKRVILKGAEVVKLVKAYEKTPVGSELEDLERIRQLNTDLADLYQIPIPVITLYRRDNSYVPETHEIYLTAPTIWGEGFLHQFRHHLQNIERRSERRGLTVEGKMEYYRIPYMDTLYHMEGEDDAIAWVRAINELVHRK